jgi:NAD(P)-dependent dehydrogenase (short-subunit alcohol dehydrogenase family)
MSAARDAHPVCLITGASSGVGLATAVLLAGQGYRLALCARGQQRLTTAAEQVRRQTAAADDVLAVAADVGDPVQVRSFVKQALEKHGRIDVLINNAGVARMGAVTNISYEDFQATIHVNVTAVFAMTQAVWPIMQHQAEGTIVNISSMAAIDPFPGFSVYGACKAWVDLFTKATAAEGRELGIRTFALRLGAVETPMLRRLLPDFPREQTLAPEEVAEVISQIVTEPFRLASGEAICLHK